jgi:methyl-accepting chemotaxis protein
MIIGTGVYIDDIDEQVAIMREQTQQDIDEMIEKFIFMIFGLVVVLFVLLRSIILSKIDKPLTDSVFSIYQGTTSISDMAQDLKELSSQQTDSSTQQSNAIDQISSNINQTTKYIQQNNTNAKELDSITLATDKAVQIGYDHIQKLIVSMDNINESSSKVSNIIKTIDEIAFQTNLLALNAAVEAARAGEHGLGFAVVAEEVRNLATKSTEAAKETTHIIEQSLEEVKVGNLIADDTNKSFQTIIEEIKQITEITDNIADLSKKQDDGMKQITQAMNEIEGVTQHLSSNSEKSSQSALFLHQQSTQMVDSLRKLVGKRLE